jgi:competence protein ComEC
MATVHFLNTDPGDCSIIEHNTGRVTMVDICDGNIWSSPSRRAAHTPTRRGHTGNFRMGATPTNPVAYAQDLGIDKIFRFVLTHPDMDHMDGFDAMMGAFSVQNYWDTGSRRDKPNPWGGAYSEADWDRYVRVRDDNEPGVSTAVRRAGAVFDFANKTTGDSDGLSILAPDARLVADCNMEDDVNDGSYVLLYRADGNRILLPGDAHDNTWDYVTQNYASAVGSVGFMLAPHHGRDSDRSYDFLDVVRPQLTLIGNAPSAHIDYGQWSRRGLAYITSDQCGNVVVTTRSGGPEAGPYLAVYVENVDFARASGSDEFFNAQGYAFLTTVSAVAEGQPRPVAAV